MRYDDLGGFRIATDIEMGDELILTTSDTTAIHYFNNFPGDTSSIIGEGTYLNYCHRNKSITEFIWKETTVIRSHINKVNSNDSFIIVDQKPLDSIFGRLVRRPYDSSYRPNMPDHHGKSEQMLKKSNIHNYWIIVKEKKEIYGPLNKEEYLFKREELGVPKELGLNE